MRRKIYLAVIALSVLLAGIFIWRLDIPNWKKLDISKLTEIPVATIVYDINCDPAGALHGGINRTFAPIEYIPDHVKQAFIAAEDLRFYEHNGIDVRRILGALLKNIKSFSYAQGASTITQQLIKTTHLSNEKRISRKVQEIILALRLENKLSKSEILESYLNTIYFGRGAYGISSAAKVYFGKEVGELTISESALLAGIIKSPSGYAPHINPEKSIARRNSILKTMAENSFISSEELAIANNEPLSIINESPNSVRYGWYMDSVLSEAISILSLNAEDVYAGGYSIYTGLDTSLQSIADELYMNSKNFPDDAQDGTPVQSSMTVMDVKTGLVRAVIGGRKYEVMRGLNRSTQIKRQPGSAFKPVSTYAAAIDAFHFVPSSTIEDTPREFSGGYVPGNAGGATYGTVTLREALSKSLNIATVDLADLISTDAVRLYAQRFGLPLNAKDINLSLSLGFLTEGVSPLELTGAYCALANHGKRIAPHFISKIVDASGKTVFEFKPSDYQAVKDSTAFMITDMLTTTVSQGSAKALNSVGMPIAAKTGTVDGIYGGTKDIWTVAFTPDIVCTVWMGFDIPDKMHEMPSTEGGSGYPAKMCAAFFRKASSSLSGKSFSRPESVKTVLVDKLALENDHAAHLITENTPSEYTVQELFHSGKLPQIYSEYWSAPTSVTDFRLISNSGQTPVFAFTSLSDAAEYVLYRRTETSTEQIAILEGKAGTEVQFTDNGYNRNKYADYTLIPRNKLLNERGILLTAAESGPIRYVPGGFLNKIMGAGTDNAVQTPMEFRSETDQSLFG